MEFNENMIWKINNRHIWSYSEDFIKFLDFRLKEPISISGLAKEIGMGYAPLKNIIEENNIKILEAKYSNKFKAIYQEYDWCYQKYFTEGLNHDEMALEANCTKRVIEKWCQDRHKITQEYRQIHKQFNETQNYLLIGSMLGDGHIDKRETQPIFIESHADDQKDYMFWKYAILKDLCNIPPVAYLEAVRIFSGKEYNCQSSHRLCTRIYDSLLKYRSASYSDLLNQMNELSLCVWLLDDGSRGHSNWDLCIAEYTQTEIDLAIHIFKERFNIKAWQKSDKRYLQIDAVSSRHIDEIVLRNIPNDLDIIKTKIINNKISKPQEFIMLHIDNKDIKLTDYCRENNLDYRRIISRKGKDKSIYEIINLEKERYNG